jgi:hypothetical protein
MPGFLSSHRSRLTIVVWRDAVMSMPEKRTWHGVGKMFSRRITAALLSAVASVLLFNAGCGTLENGRGWGEDAFFPIDGQRVARAAHDAFLSPGTLIPLAGALAFQIDGWDQKVSDWAMDHTPIFGSQDRAGTASDYLRDALILEALAMPLATPSGDTLGEWAPAKLQGYAVEFSAIGAVGGVTEALKAATHRPRPDGSDDMSFPSGHTSAAFSCATLANRNLDSIDALEGVRPALEIANTVLAAGTGWARVEAGKHYPSDVLFGAALGHFLTAFIHDAFMNLPEKSNVDFDFFSTEGGGGIELVFHF